MLPVSSPDSIVRQSGALRAQHGSHTAQEAADTAAPPGDGTRVSETRAAAVSRHGAPGVHWERRGPAATMVDATPTSDVSGYGEATTSTVDAPPRADTFISYAHSYLVKEPKSY